MERRVDSSGIHRPFASERGWHGMFLGQKIEMQMAHYTLVCHEFYAPGMNDIYVWGSALHDKARTDYRSAYSGLC